MKRWIVLLLAIFTLFVCGRIQADDLPKKEEKKSEGTTYFPDGAEKWFPKHLREMKEPSIYEKREDKAVEEYRFLWLRTWGNPIAIRVWKDKAGAKMRAVRLDGNGGYAPGKIADDKAVELTAAQWTKFLQLLDKAGFWKMKTESDINGRDGSEWVLEGLAGGQYQMVNRWMAGEDSAKRGLEAFVECCRFLLDLSGFKKEPYY